MKIDSAPRSDFSPFAEAAPEAAVPENTGVIEVPAPAIPEQPAPCDRPRPTPFSPRTRRWVLLLLAAAVIYCALQISSVLFPFLWASVVAYAFNPLVRVLNRHTTLPRVVVVGALYVLAGTGIGLLLASAIPALNNQVTEFSRALPVISADLQARYFGTQSQPLTLLWFNIDVPQVVRTVANSMNAALNGFVGGTFKVFSATLSTVTQFLLFVIVTFYLLVDAPKIGRWIAQSLPSQHRSELLALAHDVDHVLTQYLRAEGVLVLLMGSVSYVVLTILGVQFALILAPIVGILEIFPIIGPFTAITLVTIVALFSPSNFGWSHTTSAMIVALIFFILRQLEDYAVIPNVVGHAVKLHPALILFGVAVGASVGGALGLFVAVPVMGALKVIGHYLYQKLDLE